MENVNCYLMPELKVEIIAWCSGTISDCEKDSDSDRDFSGDPLLLRSADESAPMVFELLPQDGLGEQTTVHCKLSDCEKDSDSDRDFAGDHLMLSSADESGELVFELLPQDSLTQSVDNVHCAAYQSDTPGLAASTRLCRVLVSPLLMIALFLQPVAASVVHQGSFAIEGKTVRISQDKGNLVIVSSNTSLLIYRAEFDRAFWGGGDPVKSKAEANAKEKKLIIGAGTGVRARVIVYVPADVTLDVQLGEGTLEIGQLSGKIEASVANGTLEFNSGALPKGACAQARATNGYIETPWGDSEGPGAEVAPCENPQVKLRVGNGAVIVR